MRAYVDSDVLIWHLRGEVKAATLLRRLAERVEMELWLGALQRAEILFFMRTDEETATLRLLSQFKTEAVTQTIIDHAARYYRRWQPSHGIDVNDAILAATVTLTGGCIYTLNVKHYPMPEVAVIRAW